MGSFDIEHILHQRTAPRSLQLLQSAVSEMKPRTPPYYAATKPPPAVQTCLQRTCLLQSGNQERKYSSESEGSEIELGCKRKMCHIVVRGANYDAVYASVGDAMRGFETKRKPSRSVFAPSQIGIMEDVYHGKKKTYLTADYRKDIAKKTGLSETQVKRWWQNRRQKDKNRVRDSLQTLNHYLPSMMFCERPRNLYQQNLHPLNESMAQLTTTHFLLQQTPNHRLITRTS